MSTAKEQAPVPEPCPQRSAATAAPGTAAPAAPGRAAQVLALQRAAGNRAVSAAVHRARTTPATPLRPTAPSPALSPAPSPAPSPASSPGEPVVQRDLLDDISDAAGGVRDRILGAARDRARSFPGYTLLTVVLGKDPITDAPVERNGAALINGFLDIIPGSERIRQPLQESHAVEKAGAWLDAEVPKLGLTFDTIRALFNRVLDSLGPGDLLDIPGAISRVLGIFSEPIQRLRTFAAGAVKTLMEFVIEGAMALAGGAGSQVMAVIKRAGAAFDRIVADPMAFVGNLVEAAKGGFLAFGRNILTHLRNGLVAWLTAALGGVLRIPARLDLPGIIGMALEFLGITWQRVRGRLTRLIPEPVLSRLEQAAGLIADIHRRGLAAITERIGQFAEGIMDTVIGGIREWVTNNIVTAAITKLVSMFNPAGAIIQAAIAIYNTIQFFIERGRQIAALGEAIFDSIEQIASGSIGGAVQKVEDALGRAVPVLLGFLARLIGLGDIATPVRNIMQRVHAVIDSAIDRVLGWVAGIARRAAAALGIGGRQQQGADDGVGAAVAEGEQLLRRPGATEESVRAELGGLRQRHGLRQAVLHPAARVAGAFQILVQRTQADTQPVALGTTKGHARDESGALLIGRVGAYEALAGLQDKRAAATPALSLYREHVIPRQIAALLGAALAGPGVPRQGAAYEGMITVLLYDSAKAAKDATDPQPAVVNQVVADARSHATAPTENGRRFALLNALKAYVDRLATQGAAAAHSASVADNSGAGGAARGTTSDPQPPAPTITTAARRQAEQVKEFLDDATELGMAERDWPEDALAIANAVANRYQGGEPNTHANFATDIPLGPRGGTGSGKAVLTITDTGWSIRARGRTTGPGAVANRATAIAAIGNEIERLRAEESSGAQFTDAYRRHVVSEYAAVKGTGRFRTQVEIATEVRDHHLPSAGDPAAAGGRTEPPVVDTIIEWARAQGVA